MNLKDQVALITGGAQGIGRAIAEAFAREGAKISLCDVDEEGVNAAAAAIRYRFDVATFARTVDVALLSECEEWVEDTRRALGRVDVLVNNAGIIKNNLITRMSEAEWDTVIAVNLKGVFNGTKAVCRPMMEQRSGRIVNIASVVGLTGSAEQINYSAAKGGVIAMTKTCARELGRHRILVNAIAPRYISTTMTNKLSDEQRKSLSAMIPLRRLGEAEDVAGAALFLAGPDSSYITGQVLSVNGGMYM